MPRDGSGVYTRPFPDVIADTPIESAVYNGFTADVAIDANAPRPIVAGGTGATSAVDALLALGGEKAIQVVTNYDTHVFVSGSFNSAGSATAGPVNGHAFSGICYAADASNLVLEARDTTDGMLYIRRKVSGSWVNGGAWRADGLNAGGTATGDITIYKNSPALSLNNAGSGARVIAGSNNGSLRWSLQLGNGSAETGSGNVGSDFSLWRVADDGSTANEVMNINRASGYANFYGKLQVNGADYAASIMLMNTQRNRNMVLRMGTGASPNFEIINNANSAAILSLDDNGSFWVTGSMSVAASSTAGTLFFGNSGTKYLQYTGSAWGLAGGALTVGGAITASASSITAGLDVIANGGWLYSGIGCVSFSMDGNHRFFWDGANTYSQGMGNLYWKGDVVLRGDVATGGTLFFGSSGAKNIQWDGTNIAFNGANLWVNAGIGCSSDATIYGTINGMNTGTAFKAVNYQGSGSPWINYTLIGNPNYGTVQYQVLHYSGLWAGVQIDTSGGAFYGFRHDGTTTKNVGSTLWSVTSDGRTKDLKGTYTAGLDEIAALNPVRFSYKGNTKAPRPEGLKEDDTEITAEGRASREIINRRAQEREWVGLVAQECEKVMPEMISAEKGFLDGREIDDLRSADYSPLMFAMINAIKTLKARVEYLEANAKP